MKKLALSLSLFLAVGFAPMAVSMTANNSTSCSSASNNCPLEKSSSCAYKVLTKEECQLVCKAKAAAIAKNPSLAKPENRCKLWRAIVKADPSIKPICMKLRQHCRMMKKAGGAACPKSSCKNDRSCQ